MITNVEEILTSIPMEEVIGRYCDLKREGNNLVALSPFNPSEKTPSFKINNRKGIWKCFSTGYGGNDAASFLMKLKGFTFPEAIESIASQGFITPEYSKNREEFLRISAEQKEHREKLKSAIQEAVDYYKAKTPINAPCLIAGKEYQPETVAKFNLFLTGDFKTITNSDFKNKSLLQEIGIIRPSKNGNSFYDTFHSRLCFPITNQHGQIIGLTARIIEQKEKTPKYINSDDSLLYDKSKALYGLYENQQEINKKEFAYLVEGPTDVVMLHQHGIGNAVATCGTAITNNQAKLLARVTERVTVLYDGDDAGKAATIRAVEVLLQEQLQVSVLFLPEHSDPADFIAATGYDAFRSYVDAHTRDAIEWRVDSSLGMGSNHDIIAATQLAANLISLIEDETLRKQYAITCAKIIGIPQALMNTAVKEEFQKRLSAKNRLSPEQEDQKTRFGLYISKNKYFHSQGYELSNFIMKPLFLVRSRDNASRVFEIINEFGASEILIVASDDFIQLASFRKKTESLGNYLFYGKEEQYIKLRSWIYKEMYDVLPIDILGLHPAGFYAWSNGISTPEGKFIPVDKYGIVAYEDKKYFLKTYSTIGKLDGQEEADSDEFELSFKFVTPPAGTPCPTTLKEMATAMNRIFGENAVIAFSYYMSSIFRDFLFHRFDCFPHINLFGPAGSGKTFMARALTSMFGIPMRPTHSVTGSISAFFRRIAQARNAITWYEEYSEKVPEDKQEGFKNFFDGFGRTLSKLSNDTKTRNTPVHSACIISGQVLPNHDPALLERCITLFFEKITYSTAQRAYAEQFIEYAKKGFFSQITQQVHAMRHVIIDKYEETLEEMRTLVSARFDEHSQPSSRVLNNYSMIAATYTVINRSHGGILPWDQETLISIIAERIRSQSRNVESAEEISGFWQMIEYLIEKGDLTINHYYVQKVTSVKIQDPLNKTQQIDKTFDKPKTILFLRLNIAHKEYARAGKQQGISRVMELSTLKYYLSISPAYIGENRGRRFNTQTARCLVFDTEFLPAHEFNVTREPGDNQHDEDGHGFTEPNNIDYFSDLTEFRGDNPPF
jgi:DNA primase